MRILLTNDDGIHADGLAVLERIAAKFTDDVWIVAPETDQSGLAHSLTLNEPLRLRRIGPKRFALKGTPTDCVIMAVRELMDSPPDLLLSGVNSGQNIGDDVTYSGTVAGAMEGTLLGVRSIALSQAYSYFDGTRVMPWDVVETHAPDIIAKLIETEFPAKTLVNINFPNCRAGRGRRCRDHRTGRFHARALHGRAEGRQGLSLLLVALRARGARPEGRVGHHCIARETHFADAAQAGSHA